MKIGRPHVGRRLLPVGALAPLVLLVFLQPAAGIAQVPPVTQISTGGFGDPANAYAWSMAWFKGKLYVGTARSEVCVERADADFYFPGQYYSTNPIPGFPVTCPSDRYDLNLQAEIWQYTPESNTWRRVYQSPADVPNPRAPGKFVARDIGYRNMVTFTPPGGVETLFVGGVTANEYIPELSATNPPRILLTTDGQTFKPIAGAPGLLDSAFGKLPPIGYRAMTVFNGRLFVTASTSLTGDGVIEEIGNPSGPDPTFTQVSPNTLAVYELEVFGGFLYAGIGDINLTTGQGTGYGVYKTSASGAAPYQFTPIVSGGAGRGSLVPSVVSMYPFNGRLFIGAGSLVSELIRINPDDSWDLVVGSPRNTAQGFKFPISGLPDGFGNPFNAHLWRMHEHQGSLYVGTNDWSWVFATTILDPLLRWNYGFDVWGSLDGWFWFLVTPNAFGDGLYNFGSRTMVSSGSLGFIGSTNHVEGMAVWSTARGPAAAAPSTATPARLLAEVQSGKTVLSWDAPTGASRYHVLRAEYAPNTTLKISSPPVTLPPAEGSPRVPPGRSNWKIAADAWIPQDFKELGVTSMPVYVDAQARPGVRYAYRVLAENSTGGVSDLSNVATVPLTTPAIRHIDILAAVGDLARRGKISPSSMLRLGSLLADIGAALGQRNLATARSKLQELEALIVQQRGAGIDALSAEDLDIQISEFIRRVQLAQAGLVDLASLGK